MFYESANSETRTIKFIGITHILVAFKKESSCFKMFLSMIMNTIVKFFR